MKKLISFLDNCLGSNTTIIIVLLALLLFVFIMTSCGISRLVEIIEYPTNILWEVQSNVKIIAIDNHRNWQRVIVRPFDYQIHHPNHVYWWCEYGGNYKIGDVVYLTDSLRPYLHFKKL
jgi:hypothetical protein